MPGDIEYEDFAFRIRFAHRDAELMVPADKTAADILSEAGYPVETRCSDGLCGTCIANYVEGEVEHRDFVLSNEKRESQLTLCCSRAAKADGEIVLDL